MYRNVVIRNDRGRYTHQIINAEAKEAFAAFLKRHDDRVMVNVPLSPEESEAYEAGNLGIPSESDVVTTIWIKS